MQNPKQPIAFLRPGWWQDLYYLLRGIPQTREHLFSTLDVARGADLVDDDTLQMMRRVIEVSDLQVEQVIASPVLPGIDINAETARAFYDEHPEQFTRAGGREARHLLIGVSPNASDNDKTEARTRATELRQQVLDGADFAELAGSQSEDPGSA